MVEMISAYFIREKANYATVTTSSSIVSETLTWNLKSNKKIVKALLVNTKNANTFTGKARSLESLDLIAKSLSRILTIRESKKTKVFLRQ